MKRGFTIMVSCPAVSCSQMPGMLAWLFCASSEMFVSWSMGLGCAVERSGSFSQYAAKPVAAGTGTNCSPGSAKCSGGLGMCGPAAGGARARLALGCVLR
jgi:hypothetical protein